MAHKIAYARMSTADQNPDFQLDALATEGYLKIYTNVATGTKADRAAVERVPQESAARRHPDHWKIGPAGTGADLRGSD